MDSQTALVLQSVAAVAAVVLTAILAGITAYYAWATRGMLREMERAREAAQAPRVIAYADPGQHGPCLVVRNVGGSSAFQVQVVNKGPGDLTLDLDQRSVAVEETLVHSLFLAPGQAIVTMAGFTTFGSKPEDQPPIDIECSWQDEAGRSGSARSVVAFGSVMYAVWPGNLHAVADSLRDVSRELSKRR